jgi:hypothetical protein
MNKEVLKEKINKEMKKSGSLKKFFYSRNQFSNVHRSLKDFFKENYEQVDETDNII